MEVAEAALHGLVRVQRAGRQRWYHLSARPLREVADWVGHYQRFWQRKLDALGEHLQRDT